MKAEANPRPAFHRFIILHSSFFILRRGSHLRSCRAVPRQAALGRWATMKTSPFLLFAASLCIFGCGCAADLRVIEIRAVQTETESSGHSGLSASVATNLFYDVVGRLGPLGYVNSPHRHGDPVKPAWVEYAVGFTPEGASTVDLAMEIDGRHITIRGDTDIDEPKSVAALQKAMKLFREVLDERQIKYRVSTHAARIFLEKS